jgi:predicted aconitase
MRLTGLQKDMLAGKLGWPQQLGIEMLYAVGRVHDVADLIPIDSVHLGISGKSLGEPGRNLLERLAAQGGRFVVPTTLNVISAERPALQYAEQNSYEETQLRILQACEAMGGIALCSCNPFLLGIAPVPGRSVAWNESATAPYINSVLGGRTNREGATALASALTGFTPRYGMHLPEQRRGEVLIVIDGHIDGSDGFSLLGAAVGRACGDRIPVIDGLARRPTQAEHLAFGAALVMFSTVAMYHMVGITPEAPAPRDGDLPVIRIDNDDLAAARLRLGQGMAKSLDAVSIGCPHASAEQLDELERLLSGRPVVAGIKFLIHASAAVRDAATTQGLLARLITLNVDVTADSCLHVAFGKPSRGLHVATNSAKMAHLLSSDGAASVRFASLADIVEAAVVGHW